MNLKKTALAAAISGVLAVGAASPASAEVYAVSSLGINDLSIVINPFGAVNITNFSFDITNTATLNGSSVIEAATCGGIPTGAGTNDCVNVLGSPALDAAPANAPLGSPTRVNNDFVGADPTNTLRVIGTTGTDYSNADSVIRSAQLVNPGSLTSTSQIAESLLTTGQNARASALIQSSTGFTLTFDLVGGPASLALNFLADPDMRASIAEILPGVFSASGDLNVSFTLTQNTDTDASDGSQLGFVSWNPEGTFGTADDNDCGALRGLSCVETADSEDLNINVGTTANNTTSEHSMGVPNTPGFLGYGINVANLDAGTWTLVLNANTSTSVRRQVPEPGSLFLIGAGLAGLGFSVRRRKSKVF